jgi:hypothetical protein
MGSSRLDVLNAQLQTSWFALWGGLEGLSEEEYLWEPLPGSWSVRLHADGFWKRDGPGGPPVVPTIAWRMCTLAGTQTLRYDWTFGAHRLQWTDIDLPGSPAGALAFLERAAASWIQACAGLSDDDVDEPLCDWPGGPAGRPFAETLWWTNRELIAAGAEILILRALSPPG